MNYTPFFPCPNDSPLAEALILCGRHPISPPLILQNPSLPFPLSLPSDPFSPPPRKNRPPHPLTLQNLFGLKSKMGFDMRLEKSRYLTYRTDLDLPISQLVEIEKSAKSVIRLGSTSAAGLEPSRCI